MRIYTLKYDYNLPTTQQVNVPTNSAFLVGIKAVRNGVELDIDPSKITLIGPDGTLTADSAKTNGYVTFKMSVQDQPKSVMYGIDIEGDTIKDFKLLLNAYKSQVGDVDKDAGGPGTDIDVNSVKTKSLAVADGGYTVLSAAVGEESDSGILKVNGTDAKLVVGTASDIGSVRINSGGTTPNIQVGKMGTSDLAAAALSCNSTGHGLLVLDGIAFDGATLSATFAANQILEEIA